MPNKTIRCILIDDEPLALEVLKSHLSQHQNLEIIGTFSNGLDALEWLNANSVDVVFTDINMPGISGLDLVKNQYPAPHAVIFTTAHPNYAADAFEFEALDYLLKPVQADELVKAVERFKVKRIYAPAGEELYRNFLQNVSARQKRLALPGVNDIKYVELEDIIRLQAERNYTRFFFADGKEFLSAKTLKEYEEMLNDAGFVRVHRTHLVNTRFIKAYEREGVLLLKDDSEVEVSRRKKEQLVKYLKTI